MLKVLFLISLFLFTNTYAYESKGLEAFSENNYVLAKKELIKECRNNIFDKCALLAELYDNGEYIPYNENEAMNLYKKACDGGISSSCIVLGDMYLNKENVIIQDKIKADKLYKKACNLNNLRGCKKYKELNKKGGYDLLYKEINY